MVDTSKEIHDILDQTNELTFTTYIKCYLSSHSLKSNKTIQYEMSQYSIKT